MQPYRIRLCILILCNIVASAKCVFLDIDENLVFKICNMKFCGATKTDCDLTYCFEQMSSERKFGSCPESLNSSKTATNCLDDCDGFDYRCSASLKCCWTNTCNRSCIVPENLNRISTLILPPIPVNVSVVSVEHEARRTAKISWLMRLPHNRCDEQIDYIVEARMHVGHSFSKHKLGQWFVISTENFHLELMHSHNSKISYWISLQIGRFYEFRVLAVNGNGTRGRSDTTIFQLNEKPRFLSPPSFVTIDSTPKQMANSSVHTRLKWQEPVSDYPIEKYELTCSRYINEGNGSLFLEKICLPATKNFFSFYDLMPDSIYYVQVNSLSLFGRKRLRSERVSILVNTTILEN